MIRSAGADWPPRAALAPLAPLAPLTIMADEQPAATITATSKAHSDVVVRRIRRVLVADDPLIGMGATISAYPALLTSGGQTPEGRESLRRALGRAPRGPSV